MTSGGARRYHPVETTDAVLARAALGGDDGAFATLVDRHARVCLRYATRMLGSLQDAEDVTQETLFRAHRALERYDESIAFRTWLMSILINRCRTALLHRGRRLRRVVLDEQTVDAASVESGAAAFHLHDAIDRAVARLEPGQREAFLLKHVEQLSYEDISAATGVKVSALKMRVQRACERLQKLLEEDRDG